MCSICDVSCLYIINNTFNTFGSWKTKIKYAYLVWHMTYDMNHVPIFTINICCCSSSFLWKLNQLNSTKTQIHMAWIAMIHLKTYEIVIIKNQKWKKKQKQHVLNIKKENFACACITRINIPLCGKTSRPNISNMKKVEKLNGNNITEKKKSNIKRYKKNTAAHIINC